MSTHLRQAWAQRIRVEAAVQTCWHLTNSSRFKLDPKKVPAQNYMSISAPDPEAGIYVTDNPEYWVNAHSYLQPFIAEIECRFDIPWGNVPQGGHQAFLPASKYSQMTVVRVIPIDEYVHEAYNDYGWVEQWNDEGTSPQFGKPYKPPFPPGYRYEGPDVRNLTPAQVKEHRRRARDAWKGRGGSLITTGKLLCEAAQTVRGYHWTSGANAAAIKRDGLRMDHARGKQNWENDLIWFCTTPTRWANSVFFEDIKDPVLVTVEFPIDTPVALGDDVVHGDGGDYALDVDVPASWIVSVEPKGKALGSRTANLVPQLQAVVDAFARMAAPHNWDDAVEADGMCIQAEYAFRQYVAQHPAIRYHSWYLVGAKRMSEKRLDYMDYGMGTPERADHNAPAISLDGKAWWVVDWTYRQFDENTVWPLVEPEDEYLKRWTTKKMFNG